MLKCTLHLNNVMFTYSKLVILNCSCLLLVVDRCSGCQNPGDCTIDSNNNVQCGSKCVKLYKSKLLF